MKEAKKKEEAVKAVRFAVLFELDDVAVSVRRATYEVLRSILADHKIDFTPTHFSRYCLQPSPAAYVGELLEAVGAKKLSVDKVIDEVNSGIAMYLSSGDVGLRAGFQSLVDVTAKFGDCQLAALTALPENKAQALIEKLGLGNADIVLYAFEPTNHSFPRADSWMKMTKGISTSPRQCVALTSSKVSCKAALSAGMRAIAIPDEFTAFQDFGGAEAVVDSLEDLDVENVLNGMFPIPVEA